MRESKFKTSETGQTGVQGERVNLATHSQSYRQYDFVSII